MNKKRCHCGEMDNTWTDHVGRIDGHLFIHALLFCLFVEAS